MTEKPSLAVGSLGLLFPPGLGASSLELVWVSQELHYARL